MQRDADPIKGAGKAEQPGEAELKKDPKSRASPWKEAGFNWGALYKCEPAEPFVANLTACLPMLSLVITWAAVRLTSLSTGPLPMGSGTESKLWGELYKFSLLQKRILWNRKIHCGDHNSPVAMFCSHLIFAPHTHTTIKHTSQVSVTTCQM